uniref:Uncharacterized protein n=1 Tax=Arundo donax TaxID=35708 RepID=A0A0A9GIS9_ARUDO
MSLAQTICRFVWKARNPWYRQPLGHRRWHWHQVVQGVACQMAIVGAGVFSAFPSLIRGLVGTTSTRTHMVGSVRTMPALGGGITSRWMSFWLLIVDTWLMELWCLVPWCM